MIVMAVGAEARIMNLVIWDARFDQDAPVGFDEIDFAATFPIAPFREQRRQLLDHFRTDFITTTADGRPNGDIQSRRIDGELFSKLLHRVLSDCADGAMPPGMDGRDGVGFGVRKQQRYAVCRSNADALADLITDESVTLALAIRKPFGI